MALPEGITRIQSPSSINLYKQCPRKYWYRYWGKLPGFPSIHLARGKAVHEALEIFFDSDVTNVPDDPDGFFMTMKVVLLECFKRSWAKFQKEFDSLDLSKEELTGYYDQSVRMIGNYYDYFTDKIKYFTRFLPIKEAWQAVKPGREMEFSSREHHVRGFIDAIHDEAGKTIILDYKTSKRAHISPEYELQLSIYAMLYEEKFHMPDLVGIYFLKDGVERLLDVTPEMIEHAKNEIKDVHVNTCSKSIKDYPKKTSPLCRWSTGQCDFYDYCFQGKPLPAHLQEQQTTIDKHDDVAKDDI
ncbi:PD-(D/E)XK nuclease family protein [Candidatus Woesearchaeota archaeon]|nr:PD-(D/E)XK nuclease family protein [Candidatus Woesearchaeota archaeon]